jgi:hypothetical protein
MCVLYGIEQRHVQREIYCKPQSLSPQRLAPALLPHLTGHRAVTGQLTGHVSLFRFHAILSNKFGISESEVLRCLYAVCSPVGLAVQVL